MVALSSSSVRAGLELEPDNYHVVKLSQRLELIP